MSEDKQETIAVQRLQELKESNVRRQADVVKLRSRLQNLRSDVRILHTSHKLKLEEMERRIVLNQDGEATEIPVLEKAEKSAEKSIDSGEMVNEQISGTLELIERIEQSLREDVNSQLFTGAKLKGATNSSEGAQRLLRKRR